MTDELVILPPKASPWGEVDHYQRVSAEGAFWVSTPGHGGLMIPEPVAERHLSADVLAEGERFRGTLLMWRCYEEDCAYALPLLEWKELRFAMMGDAYPTDAQFVADLDRSAARWYPQVIVSRQLSADTTVNVPVVPATPEPVTEAVAVELDLESGLSREHTLMRDRFRTGHISLSAGFQDELGPKASILAAQLVIRHQRGDWGAIGEQDKARNEWSIANDARIISYYDLKVVGGDTKRTVMVLTEDDRSATTVLFPEEY